MRNFYRLTGGVLLSFLTPLAEIPSVTNIPLSGVANPLFPRPPAITITASSQSILTLAPPEHWKHEKPFLVLRPHVVPESLAPWFPPAAAPHISEPCLLHDTQTINVGSLVLSKVDLELILFFNLCVRKLLRFTKAAHSW